MPALTPEEARQALDGIDQAARQMRRALGAGRMGSNFILWGLIWIAAFTFGHFHPAQAGRAWLVLAPFGLGGSALSALLESRAPKVASPACRRLGREALAFWGALIAFALLYGTVLRFRGGADQLLFFVGVMMLGYVLMGIWLRSPILCVLGASVAAGALLGRLLVPPGLFQLWMALCGGGGLLGAGLYVRLRWR